MKKRVISLLAIASMSTSILAGCGSGNSSESGNSTVAATKAESASTEASGDASEDASTAESVETSEGAYPDLTGKTISMMAWWSGGEQEAGKAKVKACEKELGCTINATYVPYEEYLSKLNTLAAANQMPDVFALPEGNVFDWGSQGMLMDLAPEYAASGVDLDQTYLKPAIFRDDDQHVWGVGYDITTMFLYYNKDMFDEAGLEYPSNDVNNPITWDEFVRDAKALTKDANGKTPNDDGFDYNNVVQYGTLMPTSWTGFLPLLHSNDVGILNDDGTALGFTGNEGVDIFQKIADLSAVEQCAPTAATAKSSFSSTAPMVMNGQLGMLIDGGWAMSNYVNEKFDIGVAAVPMFKHPADIAWTCGFCINPKTADKEAAVAVHRWMTDFTHYIDACETAGTALGGIPQTYSVYNSDEYLQKWANLHSQAMVDAATSILNADTTVLGDNVRVKNFPSIADDTLIPQLDKVWYGEMSAADAMSTMDDACAKFVDGYWN